MAEYHGRRLRCRGCRARVPESDAWAHYRECRAPLTWPYTPDTHPAVEHTTQSRMGEFTTLGSR